MNGLDHAFQIAHKLKAELVIFHATRPKPQSGLTQDDLFQQEEEIKEKLEEICEAHAFKNRYQEISYWFLVRKGLAADGILELIHDKNFDLVVMGSKGAEGAETIAGTISAEIARKSPCPVFIIPESYPYRDIRKIVYATDLKGNENGVLNYTIQLARTFQAHVSILNVQKKEPEVAQVLAEGENLLQLYAYPDMSFHIIEKDNITEAINEFAEEHEADLVIMASSDKSFFEKILTRSQTREMAYHTTVPFLAMHKDMVYPGS